MGGEKEGDSGRALGQCKGRRKRQSCDSGVKINSKEEKGT